MIRSNLNIDAMLYYKFNVKFSLFMKFIFPMLMSCKVLTTLFNYSTLLLPILYESCKQYIKIIQGIAKWKSSSRSDIVR